MTEVTVQTLIDAKYAPNSQTTEYTSTSVKTIIDKFTVSNNSGSPATIAINLVPSGSSAGATNLILPTKTILDGEVYRCPEIVGHELDSGDFISLIAGTASALVIRSSGRIIA